MSVRVFVTRGPLVGVSVTFTRRALERTASLYVFRAPAATAYERERPRTVSFPVHGPAFEHASCSLTLPRRRVSRVDRTLTRPTGLGVGVAVGVGVGVTGITAGGAGGSTTGGGGGGGGIVAVANTCGAGLSTTVPSGRTMPFTQRRSPITTLPSPGAWVNVIGPVPEGVHVVGGTSPPATVRVPSTVPRPRSVTESAPGARTPPSVNGVPAA